jgi:hypothetical protein
VIERVAQHRLSLRATARLHQQSRARVRHECLGFGLVLGRPVQDAVVRIDLDGGHRVALDDARACHGARERDRT